MTVQSIGERTRSLERWLARRARGANGRPVAVVMGASVNGLSFARSLGRRGVPVVLLDADPLVGLYSRFAKCIPLADHGTDALDMLATIGGRLDAPGALFLTADQYCLLAADHASELASWYRFLQPDAATVRSIVDKRSQYAVAARAGIPLPATYFPASVEELSHAADQVRYPAILKPYRNDQRPAAMKNKAIKVMIAGDAEELRRAYARAAALSLDVMVQEVVPGDDSALYGYWAFWDDDGRERAWVTKRKLRQSPPLFGDGSLQRTIDAPEVADLSRRLLDAFRYRGFVGVEFKRDPRDRSFRLMEINPRTESGNQLAISAGVDFPWIGYRYLTGELRATAGPFATFRPGVTYVNEEWDLKAFLALRQRGELSTSTWLRSLRGVKAHAIGAWDDPLPLLVMAGRIGRAALRRVIQRYGEAT